MPNLPETMLAIKKTTAAAGLSWAAQTALPEMGPRDVLIRVTHAGICGTDRHIYEWDQWSASRIPIGITTGHEFVGIIERVGNAVSRVKVGQRVSAEGHIACGTCHQCRTGNAHICRNVKIIGIDRDGCFAQFVSVPDENVWPVNPAIPDHIAAVFDPLGNAVHTVMSANVSGKSVLITGVGIIGLMAVAVSRAAGASNILVTDIDDRRLALAKTLGADDAFRSDDSKTLEAIRHATEGEGPEVLLEMSGNPKAIKQGFNALRGGGTAALLGLTGKPVEFDLNNDIIFKGATVLGVNGRRMFQTWYQMETFLLGSRVKIDPVITHQLPMKDFDRGFKLMQSGEGIKIVLEIPQI